MQFKNELPLNCPSNEYDDIKKNVLFYRVSKNCPPTNEDFKPLWFLRNISLDKECLSKGISISEKLSDSEMLIKTFKNLGKYIYSGTVSYGIHGIVKLTPNTKNPSHRTWYPLINNDETTIFTTKER